MEYRELGGTGVMVPEVGIGTWQYHGGVAPIRKAIELDANLVDTAEIYGSEGIVGEALTGLRDGVFLATKVSGEHLRAKQVIAACDASLKRMKVSVIDLYQIHWPDHRVPIAETMGALEELVDAGKVRYIGVSNFSRRQCEEAQNAMRQHRIVANQVSYSLQDREIEPDLAFYGQNKITVIAYSPLGLGKLLSNANRPELKVLREVAADAGRTPAQVALNWCLSRPNVITIPKSDRPERVEENCAASGWSLTREQVERLDTAFGRGLVNGMQIEDPTSGLME